MAELEMATVHTVTPFLIAPKGKTTGVPCLPGPITVPVDLATGERVTVALLEGQYLFYGRHPDG